MKRNFSISSPSSSSPSSWSTERKILSVVAIISLSQGVVGATNNLFSYMFKDDYSFDITESSIVSTLTSLPFAIKLLWGLLSDSFPIFGYRRKSYLILTSFLCWISLFNFGISVPILELGLIFLVLSGISRASHSVIGEALVVENAQEINAKGDQTEDEKSKVAAVRLAYYYIPGLLGSTVFTLLMIFFLTPQNRHFFMLLTSFVPLSVFIACVLLPEEKISNKKESLLESGGSTLLNSQDLSTNVTTNAIKESIKFLKNPLILKVWVILLLSELSPGSGETDFYFYTEVLNFGPKFMGVKQLFTMLGGIAAIVLYNRYFTSISFRNFYTITQILLSINSLSSIILYFQVNISWGISNELFVVINSFFSMFWTQINAMPLLVLACRICPKNLEATAFAILTSTLNFGEVLSTHIGAAIIAILGIAKDDFSNYWKFPVISEIVTLVFVVIIYQIDYEKAIKFVDDYNMDLKRIGISFLKYTNEEENNK